MIKGTTTCWKLWDSKCIVTSVQVAGLGGKKKHIYLMKQRVYFRLAILYDEINIPILAQTGEPCEFLRSKQMYWKLIQKCPKASINVLKTDPISANLHEFLTTSVRISDNICTNFWQHLSYLHFNIHKAILSLFYEWYHPSVT